MGVSAGSGGVSADDTEAKVRAAIAEGGPEAQKRVDHYVSVRTAASTALEELNLGYAAREAKANAEALQAEAQAALEEARAHAEQIIAEANQLAKDSRQKTDAALAASYQVRKDADQEAAAIVAAGRQQVKDALAKAEASAKAKQDEMQAGLAEVEALRADMVAKRAELDETLNTAKASQAEADVAHKRAMDLEAAYQRRIAKLQAAVEE